MIIEDLRAEIIGDVTIATIVDERVFNRDPIDQQSLSYLTFDRPAKQRNMIRERNQFRIFAYSKDVDELETLSDAIITLFENKRSMNGNEYFQISLIGQTDNPDVLDSGFYWNVLQFQFDRTT